MKAAAWACFQAFAVLHDLPIQVQGQEDVGVLFIEVHAFGPQRLGADGDDHHPMVDCRPGGQGRGEVAHHPRHPFHPGVIVDGDLVVAGHLPDQGVKARLHQSAPPGGVQLEGVAPQAVFALHQVHDIALIRQGQGAGHAGDAAADDQGPAG